MSDPTKKEVGFVPLLGEEDTNHDPPDYGSTEPSTTPTQEVDSFTDHDAIETGSIYSSSEYLSNSSRHYSMLGDNMWTSVPHVAEKYDFALTPKLKSGGVKLVADPIQSGALYLAEHSFYHIDREPQYAQTVNTDLYRRIMCEVNDAKNAAFGLYFCCHGGDGAHTGVSHDDRVDIRLAWFAMSLIFLSFFVIEMAVPLADEADDSM